MKSGAEEGISRAWWFPVSPRSQHCPHGPPGGLCIGMPKSGSLRTMRVLLGQAQVLPSYLGLSTLLRGHAQLGLPNHVLERANLYRKYICNVITIAYKEKSSLQDPTPPLHSQRCMYQIGRFIFHRTQLFPGFRS